MQSFSRVIIDSNPTPAWFARERIGDAGGFGHITHIALVSSSERERVTDCRRISRRSPNPKLFLDLRVERQQTI